MLHSLKIYTRSEVAQQMMKIIKFYEEYGEKATKEAFGADRKVISRWKKRVKEGEGNLTALSPYSTRPHRVRCSNVSQKVINFIRELREKHPGIGKEKIKPLLDKYCDENNLKTVAESTVGNIIKRHKFFYQKAGRIYHNPNSKWAQNRVKKAKRVKIKHPVKPKDFGPIVADTVTRVTDGVKDYFYNAIDAKLKFALTLNYKRLNSNNMKDFYERFRAVYPLQIKDWQTDNGSENLGEFDKTLQKAAIHHLFIYPRCPKINSILERYNRTIQEEFIDNHLDIIHDKSLFHKHLAEYMVFYLTKRIHKSLDKMTPVDYLIKKGGMSHLYGTYTRI